MYKNKINNNKKYVNKEEIKNIENIYRLSLKIKNNISMHNTNF